MAQQELSDSQLLDIFTTFHSSLVKKANGIVKDLDQAEDIVQEAYIRFHAKMKEGYKSELSAKAYLFRIAQNLAIDTYRRKSYERRLFPVDVDDITHLISDNKSSLEELAIVDDDLQRVLACLDKLPERTRIAFEMHRFGGHTMQSIAEHFGISKSMATRLVADGLVKCRRSLSD